MIGPENTPYNYGYFFFDVYFPDDYPFSPPTIKYCTQGYNIRFNPNLYVNQHHDVIAIENYDNENDGFFSLSIEIKPSAMSLWHCAAFACCCAVAQLTVS